MGACLLEEKEAVYKCVGMDKTGGIHCADSCSLEAESLLDGSSELLIFSFYLEVLVKHHFARNNAAILK